MSDEPIDMPDAAADPVVDAILRAGRALVSLTARSLASVSEEVTLPQLRTLVVLAGRGPQTVSALADHLAVHASTMTRMCNRLVNRGLVVRAPSSVDRREVVITMSPTGTTLVDNVMLARRQELDRVVGEIDAGDRASAVRALDTFVRAAGDRRPGVRTEQLATHASPLSTSHPEDT
jgi:DNA-binding MarR family transcriptional regulator